MLLTRGDRRAEAHLGTFSFVVEDLKICWRMKQRAGLSGKLHPDSKVASEKYSAVTTQTSQIPHEEYLCISSCILLICENVEALSDRFMVHL